MEKLCEMCKVRGVCGKAIDKSKPAVKYQNRVDKLTSTVSWPTVYGRYLPNRSRHLSSRSMFSFRPGRPL